LRSGGNEETTAKKLFLFVALISGIFFLELFNPSGGIDQFLFTGKKWMTGGTYLHMHFTVHRAELDFIATRADRFNFMIFWMDIGFHEEHSCEIFRGKTVTCGFFSPNDRFSLSVTANRSGLAMLIIEKTILLNKRE
jgi:hypothetical protein